MRSAVIALYLLSCGTGLAQYRSIRDLHRPLVLHRGNVLPKWFAWRNIGKDGKPDIASSTSARAEALKFLSKGRGFTTIPLTREVVLLMTGKAPWIIGRGDKYQVHSMNLIKDGKQVPLVEPTVKDPKLFIRKSASYEGPNNGNTWKRREMTVPAPLSMANIIEYVAALYRTRSSADTQSAVPLEVADEMLKRGGRNGTGVPETYARFMELRDQGFDLGLDPNALEQYLLTH